MIGGIAGALIGAGLGASLWAAVAHFTGYEVGIVAWAVGGLVGFGASILGGRGAAMGVICAILALVAIFFGKYISMKMLFEKETEKAAAQMFTWEEYQNYLNEARAYHRANTEEQQRAFMVEYEYTETQEPEEITQEEFEAFRAESEPDLLETARNPPSYEDWKAEKKALFDLVVSAMGDQMVMDAVIENLGLFDIIFALLGIATAFKVGAAGLGPVGE